MFVVKLQSLLQILRLPNIELILAWVSNYIHNIHIDSLIFSLYLRQLAESYPGIITRLVYNRYYTGINFYLIVRRMKGVAPRPVSRPGQLLVMLVGA